MNPNQQLHEKEVPGSDFSQTENADIKSTYRASSELSLAIHHLYKGIEFDCSSIHKDLREFFAKYNNFYTVLCPNIALCTVHQINIAQQNRFRNIPEITYILPVHKCEKNKIQESLISVKNQFGVNAHCIIVIDGQDQKDIQSVEAALSGIRASSNFSVIVKKDNEGVAKARNTGMKNIRTEFFSWIDSHDIIHPLRSIHSICLLYNHLCERVNTGYARVNLDTKKIFLRNHKISNCGHTSFVARSSVIENYGFLSDLPYHEDTEYHQRLEFFNVPIITSTIPTHYLDLQPRSKHLHLSGDSWTNFNHISGHPFLEGSYQGAPTPERIEWNKRFKDKYTSIMKKFSSEHFPCIE